MDISDTVLGIRQEKELSNRTRSDKKLIKEYFLKESNFLFMMTNVIIVI